VDVAIATACSSSVKPWQYPIYQAAHIGQPVFYLLIGKLHNIFLAPGYSFEIPGENIWRKGKTMLNLTGVY
jgi:hypothetical protein